MNKELEIQRHKKSLSHISYKNKLRTKTGKALNLPKQTET